MISYVFGLNTWISTAKNSVVIYFRIQRQNSSSKGMISFLFIEKKRARNNGPIQVLDAVLKRKSFLTLNSYMPEHKFIFPWNNLGKLDLRMFFLRNDTVGIFNYKWFGSNKTNAIIRVGQLFLNGSLFWHHKHKLDGYDFIFYS